MVNVWPKNDNIRKILKHPVGGGFGAEASLDPASWPDDQFTTRRIQDGDVLTEAPSTTSAPVEKQSRRSSKSTEGD